MAADSSFVFLPSILVFVALVTGLYLLVLVTTPDGQGRLPSTDPTFVVLAVVTLSMVVLATMSVGVASNHPTASGQSAPSSPSGPSVSMAPPAVAPDPIVGQTTAGITCPRDSPERFTIAVLGDTQGYSGRYQHIFRNQTEWLATTDCFDVVYTAHVGDIVQHWNRPAEYEGATEALDNLERRDEPYGVLAGNHDNDNGRNYTYYDRYFDRAAFEDRPWYGESSDGTTNRHHYDLFAEGNARFVVVHLSYEDSPSHLPLDWANRVIDRYPNRTAVVVTHSNINDDGTYGGRNAGDVGRTIYRRVIQPNENVKLVVSGHYHGVATKRDTVGDRVVYEVLQNYQTVGRGGDGWLRLYTFETGSRRVRVRTYSPYLDRRAVGTANDFTMRYNESVA